MGGSRSGRRCRARPQAVTSELVYGRRPVRELLRGPREVLELCATGRARRAEPWLAESGLRVHVKRERELNAAAGTSEHQGVLARCEPYRYADAYELAAGESPLIACLDSVTDPRNLGAEGRGLRPLVRRACDEAVAIPLGGRVESLNVSVAAALLLYEARRQRGG